MKIQRFVTVLALVAFVGATAPAVAQDKDFSAEMKRFLASAQGKEMLGSTVEEYFKEKQNKMRADRDKDMQAELEDQFKNPVKVEIGSSPVRGNANAPVTIIEFSDFECPYCGKATETMKEVEKAYPTQVKIAFKNLPLPFHKNAQGAAKAALAAGNQGKFWEMHDELFANQRGLSEAFYVKSAEKLGLNVEQFKKDMNSPEVKAQIDADMKLAESLGVRGTPGFFVNGVAVRGALPFPHFKTIIDRWLAKK